MKIFTLLFTIFISTLVSSESTLKVVDFSSTEAEQIGFEVLMTEGSQIRTLNLSAFRTSPEGCPARYFGHYLMNGSGSMISFSRFKENNNKNPINYTAGYLASKEYKLHLFVDYLCVNNTANSRRYLYTDH